MHLHELIVQSRIGYRCEMKNGIELFVAELFVPVERCQILRYEIAAIAGQVLEVARAEIVNHRETRSRKFFLQSKREIRADEAGSAGDDQIGRRSSRRHREQLVAGVINKS